MDGGCRGVVAMNIEDKIDEFVFVKIPFLILIFVVTFRFIKVI